MRGNISIEDQALAPCPCTAGDIVDEFPSMKELIFQQPTVTTTNPDTGRLCSATDGFEKPVVIDHGSTHGDKRMDTDADVQVGPSEPQGNGRGMYDLESRGRA